MLVRNFPPATLTPTASCPRPGASLRTCSSAAALPEDQIPLLAQTAAALERMDLAALRWLVAARSYGPHEQQLLESALGGAGVRERFELRYNIPFAEMKAIMDGSRIGFVLYPGDVNYGARIPIRIFEYMARGLPFVASDLADHRRLHARPRRRRAGARRRPGRLRGAHRRAAPRPRAARRR